MSETGRSMPLEDLLSTTQVRHRIRAYDQFSRVFDLRAEDRVLCLTDPKLDPRVVAAVRGLADARGAEMSVFEASHTRLPSVPAEVVPLLRQATLVVSTWICSILDPLCIALRAEEGQRWVKITYFRNLDLLDTPQARFPIEIVSQIIRATAARFPRDQDWKLDIKDPRGGAFQIGYTAQMTDACDASSEALSSSCR